MWKPIGNGSDGPAKIGDLEGVSIPTDPINGYVLTYNSTTSNFEPKALPSGTGGTPSNDSVTRTMLKDTFASNDGVFATGYDCDTMHKEGYFMCTAGIVNPPAEFIGKTFYLEVMRINGIYSIQRAYDANDIKKVYFRRCDTRSSTQPQWIYIKLVTNERFEGKRYTAMGDSIAHGDYPNYTADALKMSLVKNTYGGTTLGWRNLTGGEVQFDLNCFFKKVENIDFTQFDLMTIAFGTNDFGTNCELGTVDSIDTNTSLGGLNVGLQTIYSSNPKIKIMLCTPIYRPSGASPNNKGFYLKDYVQGIKDVAKKHYLPVCDFHYELGLNAFNYTSYLPDGLHPNFEGQRRMSDFIIGQMLSKF